MSEEKKRPELKVQEVVQLHAVFGEDSPFNWIHTHGLVTYGLPELEIRNLPVFMFPAGARLLNQVGQYMIDNRTAVKAGENMQVHDSSGRPLILHFWESPPYPGAEDHYEVERLAIVDPPGMAQCCDECDREHKETMN
jgi:hypothetical protein